MAVMTMLSLTVDFSQNDLLEEVLNLGRAIYGLQRVIPHTIMLSNDHVAVSSN